MEAEALRINCLAALSKCQYLRQLNLSLVTESIALPQLLHSIAKLPCLEALSIRCKDDVAGKSADVTWPPRLKALEVSGTLTDEALAYLHLLPDSLTSFTIYNAPRVSPTSLKALIGVLGHDLEYLHVGPRTLEHGSERISEWLLCLPKLKQLRLCQPSFYFGYELDIPDRHSPIYNAHNLHPLERLELDCRALGSSSDHDPESNYGGIFGLVDDGYLGRLRQVTYVQSSDAGLTRYDRQIVHELDDFLRALAREDGENASIKENQAGAKVVRV